MGGGGIDGFGDGVGVDAFGVGGGFLHPGAAGALSGSRDVAVETRDARDDDLVAVSLVDHVAYPAMDGDDDGVAN